MAHKKKKSRSTLEFYTNGETIWFFTGKTYRAKSYRVPDYIVERITSHAQAKLRQAIQDLLGISK
jgi:hypothetical protein